MKSCQRIALKLIVVPIYCSNNVLEDQWYLRTVKKTFKTKSSNHRARKMGHFETFCVTRALARYYVRESRIANLHLLDRG
jgi:hypothetical protein